MLFVTGLLRGVAVWRSGKVFVPIQWTAGLICLAALCGFVLSAVESVLLVQVPVMVSVCAISSRLLSPRDEIDRANRGRVTVRVVLMLMAMAWLLYGSGTILQLIEGTATKGPLQSIVRFNSLIDLVLQVVLAGGLIIAVMIEAYDRVVLAQAESDRLRTQLQRDDKLRASATLISGVAHEINNPLTAIIGYGEDLAASDEAVRNHAVRVVREQAARCRAIMQRMAAIGSRRLLSIRSFEVRESVTRVVDGLRSQLDAGGISVDCQVAPELQVTADVAGFEQVLTNLVVNAIHVSRKGQVIVVTAEAATAGALVAVRDQGPGVPAAIRAHVFEPFWTTKRPSKGTGLGLAVVDAIVHAHGGKIEVSDVAGGGAEFRVLWPWRTSSSSEYVVDAVSRAPQSALEASDPVVAECRSARLLIIDDEPLVRATMRRQAESRGWQVDDVESAEQGLVRLAGNSGCYDAVVCDMRMPTMSGAQFHDELLRVAPEVLDYTIFVTGDLASPETTEFAHRSQAGFLAKPFVSSEFLERLELLRL